MVTNATEKGIGKQNVRAGRGSRCSATSVKGGAITRQNVPATRRKEKEKERVKEKDGMDKVIGARAVKEIGVRAEKEIVAKEEKGKGDGTKRGGKSGAIKGKGKGKGKGKRGMNEFGCSNDGDWLGNEWQASADWNQGFNSLSPQGENGGQSWMRRVWPLTLRESPSTLSLSFLSLYQHRQAFLLFLCGLCRPPPF